MGGDGGGGEGGGLGGGITYESVRLLDLPSDKMHPVGRCYFFARRNIRSEFDSTRLHPSFFQADFERKPVRHANIAWGVVRVLDRKWQPGVAWRERHGVPFEGLNDHGYLHRRKDDIETDIITPLKNPIIGQVTVLSLAAIDLRRASTIRPNSPAVIVSCGPNETRTKPQLRAGSEAKWDPLEWPFPLKNGYSLDAEVSSGIISTEMTYIGTFSMSAHTILGFPVDNYGEADVLVRRYSPTSLLGFHRNLSSFLNSADHLSLPLSLRNNLTF